MPHRRFPHILFVLLLAVTLCTTTAWGAQSRSSSEPSPFEILARVWEAFTAIWSEEGCMLDPHGGRAAAQAEEPIPPPTTDEGCMIDPQGGCKPAS
jgi:hypothetical protein